MCGIFFSCSQWEHQPPSNALLADLKRRGPDHVDSVSLTVTLQTTASRESCSEVPKHFLFLTFLASVLSMRGNSVVKQPLRDPESGSLLCWNGEAWRIGNQSVQGNDAEHVFDVLLKATKRHNDYAGHLLASQDHKLQGLVDVFSGITGPYAFVFYDAQHHRIFFGRDALGRRSLLIRRHPNATIVLSSISDPTEPGDWVEVEADGIYQLDLTADVDLSDNVDPITHIPWVVDHSKSNLTHNLVPHIPLSLDIHAIDKS